MTSKFYAILDLYHVRTKPVPEGEWRCDLGIPGEHPVGSYENPMFGCRITLEQTVHPNSSGIVEVELTCPLDGDMPRYFLVCEGKVVGRLMPFGRS